MRCRLFAQPGDEPLRPFAAASSDIPKLYFYGSPGAINPAPVVQWIIGNAPNLETRFVGPGTHFRQEDHPDLIGTGIADWLRRF